MTPLSQKILESFQVRKTKKQKTAFIELMKAYHPELQVEETKGLISTRNIVIGNVDSAKVVYTAHYDTCAELPFPNFITPMNIPLYILWNLLISLPVVLLMFAAMHYGMEWTDSFTLSYLAMWAIFALFMWALIGGKANSHTVNDNTSGVITLCEIMAAMTPEEREKAAFVFFDLEEAGLFGSSQFAKKHKKVMKEKLLVNFDCVSDGDHLLVIYSKKAEASLSAMQEAFGPIADKEVHIVKASRALYPSDQSQFPCGVGVAALNHKKGIGLYMNKIHTKRDTVLDERNIVYFCSAACRLTNLL